MTGAITPGHGTAAAGARPAPAEAGRARVLDAAGPATTGIVDALPSGMRGTITGRDVLRHPRTVVREFGPGAYARCLVALVAGAPGTFLGAVADARAVRRAALVLTLAAFTSVIAGSPARGPDRTALAECAALCADHARSSPAA